MFSVSQRMVSKYPQMLKTLADDVGIAPCELFYDKIPFKTEGKWINGFHGSFRSASLITGGIQYEGKQQENNRL